MNYRRKCHIAAVFTFVVFIVSSTSDSNSQIGYSPFIDSISHLITMQTISLQDRGISGDTTVLIGSNADTILSRNTESPYRLLARQYILQKFLSYGLNARYMVYRSSGSNVLAVKTGSKYPNQMYIICSHYDDEPPGPIAPGADDNGSGTSAVLEAARLLAPLTLDYTVVFICFDEEELGLIGSQAYSDSAYARGDSILGVFNMDMIAWDSNNDNQMHLRTDTNSYPLALEALYVFNVYQPQYVPNLIFDPIHNSDHASFWNHGYKAILCIESLQDFNPYYHTIYDNYSHINLPFFLGISRAAVSWLLTAALDYHITFVHAPINTGIENVPSVAVAEIDSHKGIAHGTYGPRLYYRINSGAYNYVSSYYNDLDTFKFSIPGQTSGSTVYYYIAAEDSSGDFVGTLPLGGRGINPPGTIAPPVQFQYPVLTSVIPNSEPVKFSLNQNYPNPFNPVTEIEFSIAKTSVVRLLIYDILGREITSLISGKRNPGDYKVSFDASFMPSGIYYYSLYLDGILFGSKKMVLIK
jgi:hypothetical protein